MVVADATEDLITDLLPPGFIKPNTTLVLTDAIYFKAQWRTIFGKYGTTEANFHLLDGTTAPTTFMRDLEKGGARGIGDDWSAAERTESAKCCMSTLLPTPDSPCTITVAARPARTSW